MKILLLAALLLFTPQLHAKAPPVPIPSALATYLAAPDTSTKWELVRKVSVGECYVWQLTLTSQTWQGIPWTHDLLVIRPKAAPPTAQMLLINSGGKFDPRKPEALMLGAGLAQGINAPVAVLLGIPRQPLFDGLREDDLIAETFVRYLETGDESWPLLFPMVKSLVKAMDALQEFSEKEWEQPTEKFIVNGASKRGWTTWLTAASDPRVSAIVPMVIDMLNMTDQLPHQQESFGKISDQIKPYTGRGLLPMKDGERDRKLWAMVDPYTYREKYTMPKLIVLGNNDPYWTTDALNLYWDGIPGPSISPTPPTPATASPGPMRTGKKVAPSAPSTTSPLSFASSSRGNSPRKFPGNMAKPQTGNSSSTSPRRPPLRKPASGMPPPPPKTSEKPAGNPAMWKSPPMEKSTSPIPARRKATTHTTSIWPTQWAISPSGSAPSSASPGRKNKEKRASRR